MGISQICETIKNYFSSAREPVQQLPRLLLVCSLKKRPGLSTIVSVSNIVKDLNMMGIPTGTMPDGSPNLTVAHTFAIVKEVFRALRLDAVVQFGFGPNAVDVMVGSAMGGNVNFGNDSCNGGIF